LFGDRTTTATTATTAATTTTCLRCGYDATGVDVCCDGAGDGVLRLARSVQLYCTAYDHL
jgi:hypothetical protein